MLKDVERKMLSELIKNSRRSDRELAKAIGTSQPTATRIRTKLEKEGYIKEYTTIPNLNKVGYAILALTFIKIDIKHSLPPKEVTEYRKIHYDALSKNPNAVLLVKRGMGLGYDAVVISLHENKAGGGDLLRTLCLRPHRAGRPVCRHVRRLQRAGGYPAYGRESGRRLRRAAR